MKFIKTLVCKLAGHKWERVGSIVDFTYTEGVYGCRRCGASKMEKDAA